MSTNVKGVGLLPGFMQRKSSGRGFRGGTRLRDWLKHYATNRKVAGSIPDKFSGFFN
jgi:hypothetical protein